MKNVMNTFPIVFAGLLGLGVYVLFYEWVAQYGFTGFFIFLTLFSFIAFLRGIFMYFQGKKHEDTYITVKGKNELLDYGIVCIGFSLLTLVSFFVFH